MDRLLTMDRNQFVARMQEEFRRTMEQVADAVNDAPDGNVINGSEVRVRDVMAEFRRKAFETAVQMRIDSTESSFSPADGRGGPPRAEKRAGGAPAAWAPPAGRAGPGPGGRPPGGGGG